MCPVRWSTGPGALTGASPSSRATRTAPDPNCDAHREHDTAAELTEAEVVAACKEARRELATEFAAIREAFKGEPAFHADQSGITSHGGGAELDPEAKEALEKRWIARRRPPHWAGED